MIRKHGRPGFPLGALLTCVGAGMLAGWCLHGIVPSRPARRLTPSQLEALATTNGSSSPRIGPATKTTIPPLGPLRVPIDGAKVEAFKGGFYERRDGRPHEAIDVVAPRGAPVHAVQDGTIAKLFYSKAGGNTIYQFDRDADLCYYYAHLERYAENVHEGLTVSQGQVIGYVGTSGNAPPNAPHLHFAVIVLDKNRRWWEGRAIDPYPLFTPR